YNLDFAGAHQILRQYQSTQPGDPMGPVSEAAAYLFAEFDRLQILQSEFFTDDHSFLRRQRGLRPDSAAKREFDAALARTDRTASAALRRDPNDQNALLAGLLRVGLHSDYLAFIEKRNLAALSELKQGRELAESLLRKYPQCYDAHIAIGVENYLLSLKPAPVRWLLRLGGAQTDRQAGIERIRITAAKGHYLLPYARLMLAVAALREKDVPTARHTLAWLAAEFPANRLYREELAKLK
ncbi:MAG TPA: hypothetical protein VHA11_09390, partial [Bryobacteraceae bacterium]|nr:hypothetical protein [Bryobacteraceae bacterium]